MKSGCKFCGEALMVRWCAHVTCGRFLDVPMTEEKGFTEFYLERRDSFIRTLNHDGCLCEECGRVLAIKSLTNPCPVCLRNEPDTILKRFEERDKDALRAELGYSSAVSWRTFHEDAGLIHGKEWEGYTLELLGVELGRFSDCVISDEGLEVYRALGLVGEDNGRVLLSRSYLFPFTCIPDLEDPDLIIELCRIRVRYQDSPLLLEMRSHPYGVRRTIMYGLENDYDGIDRERAEKARELLIKIAPPESQPGPESHLQGETLASIAQTYAWLWFCADAAGLKEPNQEDLLGVYRADARQTLYRYIKRLGGNWTSVKKEGKRIAKTLTLEAIPRSIRAQYHRLN